MLYSAYFAERAELYRELAMRAPNGRQAECQLGLANLFLEMSFDTRLRELAVEPTAHLIRVGTECHFIKATLKELDPPELSGIGAIFHPVSREQDCQLGRFNKFPYVSLITFAFDPHRIFMCQILFWMM
jgi:hypothetical protein